MNENPKKDHTILKGTGIGTAVGTGLALLTPMGLGAVIAGAAGGAATGAIVKHEKNKK